MSSTIPYIGSKISLISNSEIRYEGILYTINTQESTIALQSVKTFGTEGRKIPEIPPSSEIYDFIIFRGTDIKDLTVLEGAQGSSSPMFSDPAIMSMNQRPAGGSGKDGKDGHKGSGKPAWGKGSDQRQDKGGGWGSSQSWNQPSKGSGKESSGYGGSYWGQSGWGKGDGYGKGGGKWDDGGRGRDNYGSGYSMKGNDKGKESSKGGKGKGGKDDGKGSKGKGKGDGYKGGSYGKSDGKGYNTGKGDRGSRSKGGSKGTTASGVPVGELLPEENAAAKQEYAEEFDVTSANIKFDKVKEEDAETMKPLAGYNKSSSFFDNISCEATDRANETDRPKIDREKARQYDKDTFGDTRRPPRLTGVRRGKGKGGKGS